MNSSIGIGADYACQVCESFSLRKEVTFQVSDYVISADKGCSSCKLLLDSIETIAPFCRQDQRIRRISVLKSIPSTRIILRGDFKDYHQYTRVFDLFIEEGHPKCSPMLTPESKYLEEPWSDCTYDIATQWLNDCVQHHDRCRIPNPDFVPRRLIDVGDSDADPYLQETVGSHKYGSVPYVALSYCWGRVTDTLKTTTQTLEQYHHGIPLSLMPQTIRDAVDVCRKLHRQYLWVDAFCIVQDDTNERDWYEQSGLMGQIYSNAELAIAVDGSPSCDSGFLQQRDIDTIWRKFFPRCSKDQQLLKCWIRDNRKSNQPDPWPSVAVCPLSKRGWALQESILPNRTLHFAGREMVWECNCLCLRELGDAEYSQVKLLGRALRVATQEALKPKFSSADVARRQREIQTEYEEIDEYHCTHFTDFANQGSRDSVFWAWQLIVEHYSERELSKQTDKLAAISGLASCVVDRLGLGIDSYVAGLWKDNLARGLLWYVRGSGGVFRPPVYRAPSWSWASVNGGVEYFKEHYQFSFQQYITICNVHCTVSPLDPTGRVMAASLELYGKLTPVTLRIERTMPNGYKSEYTGMAGCASHSHPHHFVWVQAQDSPEYEVLPDELLNEGRTSNYCCFRIGHTVDNSTTGARMWWLLLRKEHETTSVYRRVGIGYYHYRLWPSERMVLPMRKIRLFDHASENTITLV